MRYQIYQDKAGEYRWRLRASNHAIIATGSEGYVQKKSCLRGIQLVMESRTATVEDQSDDAGEEPEPKPKPDQVRQSPLESLKAATAMSKEPPSFVDLQVEPATRPDRRLWWWRWF